MKLIREKTLSDTITALEKKQEYTTPLTWAGTPEGTGHRLFQSLIDMPKSIIGKAPNEFTTMQNVSSIPSPLPSLEGRQLCRLYQLLNNNGNYRLVPVPEDGDCFFGSFRRSTGLPYDCADVHVRRILPKGICNNHEFFFNLFKCSIAQTYGHDRDTEEELQRKIEAGEISPQDLREQRLPGPFSFLAWLRYMSRNSSYADIHIMMATSMMWNIRLTLLYAESLKEVRFRHHKRIAQADMVMVLCQDTEHIVSAGKFFISSYAFFIRDHRKHCKNPWV